MAKKKVTYSVFATVTVDEDTDPNKVNNILQRAANQHGWQYAGAVQEDPDGDLSLDSIYEEVEADY